MSNSNSVVACGGSDDDRRSLRERMLADLKLRGMAKRTIDGYLREVRKLACYYNTSPDLLTEQQVGDYLLHLVNRNYAPGSLRVAYSGIKFFYKYTEPRDWDVLRKLRIPKQKTLPSVLTIQEVHQIIGATQQFHHAAFFWTLYSLGLRLEEGLNLQPADLDAARMMVHIHRGKGAKDRYLPLPTSTLHILRKYWSTHRHPWAAVSCTWTRWKGNAQRHAADGWFYRARLYEAGRAETRYSKECFSTHAAAQYGFASIRSRRLAVLAHEVPGTCQPADHTRVSASHRRWRRGGPRPTQRGGSAGNAV